MKNLTLILFTFITLLSVSIQAKDRRNTVVAELNTTNYTSEISSGIVLVDYWAPWSASSRRLSAVINDLSSSASFEMKVVKMNVDSHKAFSIKKGIKSVPTMILYKDGEELTRFSGLYTKEELEGHILKILEVTPLE